MTPEHREWLEYEIALYLSPPVNDSDRAQAERLQRELIENSSN